MVTMRKKSVLLLLYCVFIVLPWHNKPGPGFISGVEGAKVKCIEKERQALVKFKQEVIDDYGVLSSWGSEEEKSDCCKWRGVGCNNRTGHVTLLDLHSKTKRDEGHTPLQGNISNSLLELKHLTYLDLSCNRFHGSPFPYFIGSLANLRYLNLSEIPLVGSLSYQRWNLSRLQYLDLSLTFFINYESLDWLSHLSSLEHLDMTWNNLSRSRDWLQVVNNLPNMKDLRLGACSLSSIIPPSLSFINASKSLSVLDLSSNDLTSSIFPWLSNFSESLVHLDLSSIQLQGSIPDAIRSMSSLTDLDLAFNQLEGGIPMFMGEMCSLRKLDLSYNNLHGELSGFIRSLNGCTASSLQVLGLCQNQIHGSLPEITRFSSMRELDLSYNQLNGSLHESIGSLSLLEDFYVQANSLEGLITEAHFRRLSNLRKLDLSFNSLDFKFGSDWVPPFQLESMLLRSCCNLGPSFPKWLRNQNNISVLDISGAKISDTIPDRFWDLSPRLPFLNLSNNQLTGMLPDLSSRYSTFIGFDLSSNQFEGPLPPFPSNTTSLNLSENNFSGSLSLLCEIVGEVLSFLDLSNNLFSGKLPDCFMHWQELIVLNLANNKISGGIPFSMGSLLRLETLSLRNNSLSGELPSSLKNCGLLKFLDLSKNRLSGRIPAWIGESLSNLIFISLKSNRFHGRIPLHLCQLTGLQILDLSVNDISGTIPECLKNCTAMIRKGEDDIIDNDYFSSITSRTNSSTSGLSGYYIDKALLEWKGKEYEYKRNLGLLRVIDFASNKLIGEIPEEITSLSLLVVLNFSGNNLSGAIPEQIGQLKELESLDLSGNHLSGVIPATVADLNFLSYLNLSYNYLSGEIPSSTQLQSFNSSSFAGNLALCGLPLTLKCPGDDTHKSQPANDDSQGNADEFSKWFYTAMGIGFSLFFWGVSSALLLKRSWRHAYFQLLDELWDWFYLMIAVHWARLRQKFQSLQTLRS